MWVLSLTLNYYCQHQVVQKTLRSQMPAALDPFEGCCSTVARKASTHLANQVGPDLCDSSARYFFSWWDSTSSSDLFYCFCSLGKLRPPPYWAGRRRSPCSRWADGPFARSWQHRQICPPDLELGSSKLHQALRLNRELRCHLTAQKRSHCRHLIFLGQAGPHSSRFLLGLRARPSSYQRRCHPFLEDRAVALC